MKKLLTTTILALLPLAATAAELKPTMPNSVANAAAIVSPASTTAQLPQAAGLSKASDYSVFLRNDVPVDVQRAALRMLWTTQPTQPAESGGGAF